MGKGHRFYSVGFCRRFGSASVVDKIYLTYFGTGQVSKAWEEVASVNVVGESIVIGRYQGGNISLKAALAPRRYGACCARVPGSALALCQMCRHMQPFKSRHADMFAEASRASSCRADGNHLETPQVCGLRGTAFGAHTAVCAKADLKKSRTAIQSLANAVQPPKVCLVAVDAVVRESTNICMKPQDQILGVTTSVRFSKYYTMPL